MFPAVLSRCSVGRSFRFADLFGFCLYICVTYNTLRTNSILHAGFSCCVWFYGGSCQQTKAFYILILVLVCLFRPRCRRVYFCVLPFLLYRRSCIYADVYIVKQNMLKSDCRSHTAHTHIYMRKKTSGDC